MECIKNQKGLVAVLLGMAVVLGSYSFVNSDSEPTCVQTPKDTATNYAAVYGEYIFKRESCGSCHVFEQTNDPRLVSLDGLGGKYSDVWHVYHLEEPGVMVPGSQMPSFAYLISGKLNKETYEKIVGEKEEAKWKKLLKEVDRMLVNMKKSGVGIRKRSEILALIAYLQTIQPSEELKKKAAMERKEAERKDKIWEGIISDLDNFVAQALKDSNNVLRGKDVFHSYCVACHGSLGGGVIGPNLTDDYWLNGGTAKDIAKSIILGIPEKGMMSWRFELDPKQVGELVAYVRSIKGTEPPNPRVKQGIKE